MSNFTFYLSTILEDIHTGKQNTPKEYTYDLICKHIKDTKGSTCSAFYLWPSEYTELCKCLYKSDASQQQPSDEWIKFKDVLTEKCVFKPLKKFNDESSIGMDDDMYDMKKTVTGPIPVFIKHLNNVPYPSYDFFIMNNLTDQNHTKIKEFIVYLMNSLHPKNFRPSYFLIPKITGDEENEYYNETYDEYCENSQSEYDEREKKHNNMHALIVSKLDKSLEEYSKYSSSNKLTSQFLVSFFNLFSQIFTFVKNTYLIRLNDAYDQVKWLYDHQWIDRTIFFNVEELYEKMYMEGNLVNKDAYINKTGLCLFLQQQCNSSDSS